MSERKKPVGFKYLEHKDSRSCLHCKHLEINNIFSVGECLQNERYPVVPLDNTCDDFAEGSPQRVILVPFFSLDKKQREQIECELRGL